MNSNELHWLSRAVVLILSVSCLDILKGNLIVIHRDRKTNIKFNCTTEHQSHNLYMTVNAFITYQFTYYATLSKS